MGTTSAIPSENYYLGLPTMNMKQVNFHNSSLIVLSDDFDAQAVAEIRPALESICTNSPLDVIVDLSGVTFMDSSGIGALVFLYKRLRSKGRSLVLVGTTGQPEKLIGMLRIDKTLTTFSSLQDYVVAHGAPL